MCFKTTGLPFDDGKALRSEIRWLLDPHRDVEREYLGCLTLSDDDDAPAFIIALLGPSEKEPVESQLHPLIRGVFCFFALFIKSG